MALKRKNRKTGKEEIISQREIKATTMKLRGWTESEYNKQRYLLKNKLRAYETLTNTPVSERQSPSEILYKEARSIQSAKRRGETYQPSFAMQRIKSMPATGNVARFEKKLESETYRQKMYSQYSDYTMMRFAGLIKADPKAAEIAEKVTDPVKREQALIAYANERHKIVDKNKKATAGEAIPVSESFGSESIEFDYSMYVDE